MNVLHTGDDLPKIKLGLFLSDLIVLNEVVQLTLRGQLHYHKNVVSRIKHFIQLNDIGMVDELKNLNFALHLYNNLIRKIP